MELGASVAHGVTSFAAANLKGTNIPAPSVAPAVQPQHKTLPHALSRASLAGAQALGTDLRLGKALDLYGGALQKVHKLRTVSPSSGVLSVLFSRSALLASSRTKLSSNVSYNLGRLLFTRQLPWR